MSVEREKKMPYELLKKQIAEFVPLCEQEKNDKEIMEKALACFPDILTRENKTAHFTASAWIKSETGNKVLMLYHNIFQSWSWTGGHADGDENLLQVALREAAEETGIKNVRVVSPEIFSLEILTVDGHEKRGNYIPSHLHYNVTYLLEASEKETLRIKPDENSGVQWIAVEELEKKVTEEWMMQRIYRKLSERMKNVSKSGRFTEKEWKNFTVFSHNF